MPWTSQEIRRFAKHLEKPLLKEGYAFLSPVDMPRMQYVKFFKLKSEFLEKIAKFSHAVTVTTQQAEGDKRTIDFLFICNDPIKLWKEFQDWVVDAQIKAASDNKATTNNDKFIELLSQVVAELKIELEKTFPDVILTNKALN